MIRAARDPTRAARVPRAAADAARAVSLPAGPRRRARPGSGSAPAGPMGFAAQQHDDAPASAATSPSRDQCIVQAPNMPEASPYRAQGRIDDPTTSRKPPMAIARARRRAGRIGRGGRILQHLGEALLAHDGSADGDGTGDAQRPAADVAGGHGVLAGVDRAAALSGARGLSPNNLVPALFRLVGAGFAQRSLPYVGHRVLAYARSRPCRRRLRGGVPDAAENLREPREVDGAAGAVDAQGEARLPRFQVASAKFPCPPTNPDRTTMVWWSARTA